MSARLTKATLPADEIAARDRAQHLEMIERCRAGDRSAATWLVRTYSPVVQRLGACLLRRSDELEDFSQEVFLRAFRSLDTFRGECSFKTWISKIAINTSHRLRSGWLQRLRTFIHLSHADDTAPMDAFPDLRAAGPDGRLFSLEFQRALRQALQSLSAPLREAFVLRDLEDLSYEEIAHVTGAPLNTVRSRIAAGRAAVGASLQAILGAEALRAILDGDNP